MPEKETPEKEMMERAQEDAREGKAPSTQAGEFVREEIEHVRQGKHGVRSTKQAIAIGLSKARRAGVELPPPQRTSAATPKQAGRDEAVGQGSRRVRPTPTLKRRRAAKKALGNGGKQAVSTGALRRQGKQAAGQRTQTERSRAAKKAARTRKTIVPKRRGAKK